tara:strand:- start:39 stop:767 length:729 start_codon:yes stop_codon:yes gene_type:complete
MSRTISWFSCGAASAVATKLSDPDIIAYCDVGSEHLDNKRFMKDCAVWFGKEVTLLSNPKFKDTWEVWEKRKYISGIAGAPCTSELKVAPRLAFQLPDDIHIFGYTADGPDVTRAKALTTNWPELSCEFPLIDRGLTKAACMAMVEDAGLKLPEIYSFGFPNANCVPCCKATSPAYWAMVRKHFPEEFNRMAELSRRLGARLARVNGERVFVDEVPQDQELTKPLAPDCDFLCSLAEQDLKT